METLALRGYVSVERVVLSVNVSVERVILED